MTALKRIGGSNGRANGKKVLHRIVDSIISPGLLSNITWTGKSGKKNVEKIKFEIYTNVIQLICDVCIAADRKLDEQSVIHELKYAVLKYAHMRAPSSTVTSASASDASQSPTPDIVQNIEAYEIVVVDQNQQHLNQHQQHTVLAAPHNSFGNHHHLNQQTQNHTILTVPLNSHCVNQEQLQQKHSAAQQLGLQNITHNNQYNQVHTIDSYSAPNWSYSLSNL